MHGIGRIWPLALLLGLFPAAAQAPSALDDFEAGRWQAHRAGGSDSAGRCVASSGAFITGGRTAGCRITPISSSAEGLVATWRCDRASGRTAIRRDTGGVYTVDIQGIEGALPFADRAEWRRIGAC